MRFKFKCTVESREVEEKDGFLELVMGGDDGKIRLKILDKKTKDRRELIGADSSANLGKVFGSMKTEGEKSIEL